MKPGTTSLDTQIKHISLADRIRAHIQIARIDHWTKNVFILPGIIIPATILRPQLDATLVARLLIGFLSACLIASSNYVINEMLDAPYDRLHPTKYLRPAARGLVNFRWGYVQWIVLMLVGLGLAWTVSRSFFAVMAILWLMGCIYNIRPIRTKDLPYVDVLSEAVNNPLRMLAGWYMVTEDLIAPASLLLSYWMVGCYFMGLKRFSEYREIGDSSRAAAYRKSFGRYTERALIVSVIFYASAAMLFFGAFMIRYRMELVFAFPFVSIVMAIYCNLAFEPDSAVQNPEYLYRQKSLMAAVCVCAFVMIGLLMWDLPWLSRAFGPTLPTPVQ
jgi:decaprenyl-phosphate phosphoribosyltransferase